MKKIIPILLCMIIAFVSCDKSQTTVGGEEPEVEKKHFNVSPRSFSWKHYRIDYAPTSTTFNVESNAEWYCYMEGGFTGGKLSKTEGKGNGGVTYSFDQLKHMGQQERGTLYFVWTDENNKTQKVSCSLYRKYASIEEIH